MHLISLHLIPLHPILQQLRTTLLHTPLLRTSLLQAHPYLSVVRVLLNSVVFFVVVRLVPYLLWYLVRHFLNHFSWDLLLSSRQTQTAHLPLHDRIFFRMEMLSLVVVEVLSLQLFRHFFFVSHSRAHGHGLHAKGSW